MRVLQLIATSGPGGAESVVMRLSSCLKRLDASVILASWGRQPYLFDQAGRLGIECLQLGWQGSGRSALQLTRLLRLLQPEILHSHMFDSNIPAGLAGVACRIPTVMTVHSTLHEVESWKRRAAYSCLSRLGVHFTAISDSVTQALLAAGIPRRAITCIRNGVDVPSFQTGRDHTLRSQLGIGEDCPVVGMVANIRPAKDHALLIKAIAVAGERIGDVHLVCVGEGSEADKARLMDMALRLGLKGRVHMLGLREDIPTVLRSFNLFVLASRMEGLPISIIEAMAAGVPVVASDVGGVGELVLHGETGILVAPCDCDALAEAVIAVLSSQDMADRMGAAGRRRAESAFDLQTMTQQYMNLYQDCLGGRESGGYSRWRRCSGSRLG